MNLTDIFVANGGSLDEMSAIKPVVRIAYSSDQSLRPNDHCYWDGELGLWMENDEAFRARILAGSEK